VHHFPGPSSKLDLTSRRIRIIVDVLAFRQMRVGIGDIRFAWRLTYSADYVHLGCGTFAV
jgi:hypothetical protein